MPSPFTFTPGKAGSAYIDMHYADEILDGFTNFGSEKNVYKILGLRGSGKSVVYSKVLTNLKHQKNWLVYTVSAGGDPTEKLIGLMSRESFISGYEKSITLTAEGGLEGNLALVKGSGTAGAAIRYSPNQNYFSKEAVLKKMVLTASEKGYHILVGVDDIAKTKEMSAFLSIVGDMLLDSSMHIYLLCTGLTKNIEDFAGEPHLSFFVRSDRIEVKHLSFPQMAYKYQELLKISAEEAKSLSLFTEGYAYAYQVLGELCYKHRTADVAGLQPEFNSILADQYDIIWNTLTAAEQNLARIIVNTSSGSVREIKGQMDNPASYSMLRGRLIKKHLIDVSQNGIARIRLPRFKEYIQAWH